MGPLRTHVNIISVVPYFVCGKSPSGKLSRYSSDGLGEEF